MGSFAQSIIEGNIGRVEEKRTLPSGSEVTNFTVAVSNPGRVGADGKRGEGTTDWYKCAAWNNGNQKNADVAANFLHVGGQVLLVGKVLGGAYLKDGAAVATNEFTVNQIVLLGKASDNADSGAPATASDNLSDIPF